VFADDTSAFNQIYLHPTFQSNSYYIHQEQAKSKNAPAQDATTLNNTIINIKALIYNILLESHNQ
jgi:hypothetical protein